MTDTQATTSQPHDAEVQGRFKDLEEENELLLLQLHQVQEELECYFLRCQEFEKRGGRVWTATSSLGGWVDDELASVQAEAARLSVLVETQKRLCDIESKNSLNARLGDILIKSISPSGSLLGLPAKLFGIWRASTAEQPPAILGGKNFDKVIDAFQAGGLEAVSQLLASIIAPEMRAKAYTALARHQMKSGLFADAALSARRAFAEEPKPFRLKWLAFRLHDAGELAEADACLSLLSQDAPFSDSEARQRDQVRYEAQSARLREAKQKTGFESRRQAMESQMQTLRHECDEHVRLAAEREAEIESLQQAQARLEQAASVLTARLEVTEHRAQELDEAREGSAKLATEREEENELLLTQLHQVQEELERHFLKVQELEMDCTRLEQEKSMMAEQQEVSGNLLAERYAEIESLRQVCSKIEQEKLAISKQRIESSLLLSERQAEIRILNETRVRLEQEKSILVAQGEESANLAAARLGEIENLNKALNDVLQEKARLTAQMDESVRLSAERQAKIDSLRQDLAILEQDKAELASQQEYHTKLLAARQEEIESLQQALAQSNREGEALAGQHEHVVRQVAKRQAEVHSLRQAADKFEQKRAELEKSIEELTGQRDKQSRLAKDRGKQIEEMRRNALEKEAAESELATRQEMIREEMARAEAQLDLLKEILLREQGL